MGILRDNRYINYFLGNRGGAFNSLDEVVASGVVKGIETDKKGAAKAVPASYTSDKSGIQLDMVFFDTDGKGTNYRQLAKPKDYADLLAGFKNLYGLYGRRYEHVLETQTIKGNEIQVDYAIRGSDNKERANVQVQIDKSTGKVTVTYEQTGRVKKEKYLVSDINRICEVLESNKALFKSRAGKGKKVAVP